MSVARALANPHRIKASHRRRRQCASRVWLPGQYYDAETGLVSNGFRDCYEPATGRYCEPDPIGQAAGPSLYTYVGNNPLMYVDPLGLQEVMPFPGELTRPMPQAMSPGETLDPAIPDTQTDRPNCPRSGDPCKGLRDQLRMHEKKLREYIANPNMYDNLGFLGKGYDDLIIPARIRSLERQIANFKRQLKECEAQYGPI